MSAIIRLIAKAVAAASPGQLCDGLQSLPTAGSARDLTC